MCNSIKDPLPKWTYARFSMPRVDTLTHSHTGHSPVFLQVPIKGQCSSQRDTALTSVGHNCLLCSFCVCSLLSAELDVWLATRCYFRVTKESHERCNYRNSRLSEAAGVITAKPVRSSKAQTLYAIRQCPHSLGPVKLEVNN